MGEIGIPRHEALHELRWVDIHLILHGNNRRHRDLWASTRWQTYNLMCSFAGGKSLAEAGIHRPSDLLPFPWEQEDNRLAASSLTDEDRADLQALIAAEQARMDAAH